MNRQSDEKPQILTVTELNRRSRQLLEMHLNQVWVEGEISNLATPSSGHWYFTLKDDKAQIRCAMFRGANSRIRFRPQNGTQARVRARVSVYEPRGDYQLIVDHMEDAGLGALQQAFEALKKQLAQEGLFATEHKQALPAYPDTIGVITSPTGAAIRDILHVLERRYPLAEVILIPVAVQGKAAAGEIAAAIEKANQLDMDVLIVGRGGGSLEDLWAFNEEIVARAIFASEIPVVSAVGHEIDFSIADFVADVRAPTPSAAAEIVSPDQEELENLFNSYLNFFIYHLQQEITRHGHRLQITFQQLTHPGQKLTQQGQQIDHLEIRLQQAMINMLAQKQSAARHEISALRQFAPREQINLLRTRVGHLTNLLRNGARQSLQQRKQKLGELSHVLNSVSPLNTLNRGYAIVSEGNHVITDATKVAMGTELQARLKRGRLTLKVTGSEPEKD
jgi:exodeoxyribonuclease VII large subunit